MEKRISDKELAHNYGHHAPYSPGVALDHSKARLLLLDVAQVLNSFIPEGRHKALMHTALEEARVWANTAIAVGNSSHGTIAPPECLVVNCPSAAVEGSPYCPDHTP